MLKHWKIISINLIAVIAGLYLATNGLKLPGHSEINSDQIDGFFWPDQKELGQFSLVDHTAAPYTLESLEGQWNVLFFGYTNCPDICPVTMSTLGQVNKLLKQQESNHFTDMKIHFISVDGERDNSEHLSNYITFFGPEFLAASGTTEQVNSLTGQLGVPYEIEPHEPGDDYLVYHSGALFLISPDGKLFALFQAPYTAEKVTNRLNTISNFIDQES